MIPTETVRDTEKVVRILHREWMVDGELQFTAFALSDGETYLSVNRPAIDTFSSDVLDFVSKHPGYHAEVDPSTYCQASLQVSDVRNIDIRFKEKIANLAVEVEPRAAHYKSHAGIFTRIENKNVKGGQKAELTISEDEVVSYDDILQKVCQNLLKLAQLEICHLKSE